MAVDCLSLPWLWGFAFSRHDHRLFFLVMAIDCLSLSLSWLWPSTVFLSPGHGHPLSFSLLVMAIDCLSLPPLIVEIGSLSLCFFRSWGFALSLAMRIGSFSLLAMASDSLSLGRRDLLSLSLVRGDLLLLFLSLSVGKGYLPLPLP